MHRIVFHGVLLILGFAAPATAAMFHVLAESDTDEAAGGDFFVVSYKSLVDLKSDTAADLFMSQLNFIGPISARGLAYDGSQFHMLVESDADQVAGREFSVLSFNSLADLASGNASDFLISQLNFIGAISSGGLAYDGSQFHLLVESDTDQVAGREFSLLSFNSLADLTSGNISDFAILQLNFGAPYSARGLAYDGSQFHVLAESDADEAPGGEFFVISYNSLADLKSDTAADLFMLPLNFGAQYSAAGFVAIPDATQIAAPEPATGILFAIGMLGLLACRRRGD